MKIVANLYLFYVAREGAENNEMKTVVSLLRANYLKRQARLKFSICNKGVTFVNTFDYFLIPKYSY